MESGVQKIKSRVKHRGKWCNPDTIKEYTIIPQATIGDDPDYFHYLITYKDGDFDVVTLHKEDYKERALIQGVKGITSELTEVIAGYEKEMKEVNEHYKPKGGEIVIERNTFISNEEDGTRGNKVIYIAFNPKHIEGYRLHLYDIIGRLITSSPYFSMLSKGDVWYDDSDLHHQLFLDADSILCCTRYTSLEKNVRVYYLIHFLHGSGMMKRYFKKNGLDVRFDEGYICEELKDMGYNSGISPFDLHIGKVINDEELFLIMLVLHGYNITEVANYTGYTKQQVKNKLTIMMDKVNEYYKN